MAEEALAVGAAAVSCLQWYLEDPGCSMNLLMRTPLMAGHRGYLGFLERTLPAAAGPARAAAAAALCRALGVLAGASADERDAEGLTPLMRAAADGAGRRALRCLAAAGADLEARDGGARRATAVWWAARCGHADAVEELGRLGADVNTVSHPGAMDVTPVCIAAENGYVEVIEALGRLGADVNRARLDGATPVFMAAQLLELSVRIAAGGLFPGWDFLLPPVLQALMWPVITVLLLAPQRRAPDPDKHRPL